MSAASQPVVTAAVPGDGVVGRGGRRPATPIWVRRFLAVPLVAKLAGANALLVVGTAAAARWAHLAGLSTGGVLALVSAAGGLILAANLLLVWLALRPLHVLERTAEQVWRGDFGARVPRSSLADRDLARVGDTFNRVLDGLVADRDRLRHLAGAVIRAGDTERGRIAYELHDGAAQTLAALKLELAALREFESSDPECATRVSRLIELADGALEEVRTLALAVHPRVLTDLGLPAALRALGRETEQRDGPAVPIAVEGNAARLGATLAAVLFHVGRESLHNAVHHGHPNVVEMRLTVGPAWATLEVVDDGQGFDPRTTSERPGGLGLFTMRERVSLSGGIFNIESAPGAGTRVRATVPLEHAGSN